MAKPPRVHIFRYPIPVPILEGWKAKVTVDSYAATLLATAMGHSILASLGHGPGSSPTRDATDPHCITSSILGLANDIQAILGDALAEAATVFSHTPPATPNKSTLPRHLLPKSVRHNVSNIRRRSKVIRRLIKHETKTPAGVQDEPPLEDISLPLWSSVNTPLSLRTVLSPPPKGMVSLGVLLHLDPIPKGTTTLHPSHECIKGLRKATRLLIRHARNLRRLKYGKARIRMFVYKPSVTLNSILRASEGTPNNPRLPTDLSVLRDEPSRRLLTTPSEVIT
jgi:hypothetical protein